MTIDTHTDLLNTQNKQHVHMKDSLYKILIITQNNLDLELMKKSLESMDNCKVYEAGNLKSTFKITSHLDIDLIIVDEKLPSAEGFEIIDTLNRRKLLKEVPKILLINSGFKKERYDSYRDINLDFLRKPIDTVMLKARVNTLFKNMHKQYCNSIFEEMLADKIEEAKSFLRIYKSFLDVDENILFIYDKKSNKIIEGNNVFLRFFDDIDEVNQILNTRHLFKKYVPFMEDANYLNHYNFHEWDKIAGVTDDFHFALKVKKEATPYTFTMLMKRVDIKDQDMYVVKLLNNQHYLPVVQDANSFNDESRKKINEELLLIKDEIDLNDKERSYRKIYLSLRKISEVVNKDEKKDLLNIDEVPQHLVNAYFIIATLLKNYSIYKTLYLNGVKVDKNLEENREEIYIRIDPNALHDTIKGIIDSYFTAPVQYDKRRIKVSLFHQEKVLKIEIKASERIEKTKELSVIDKLLKKEELTFSPTNETDIFPKNVQQAIAVLKADIRHFSADGEIVFRITVPILEKS